MLIKLLRILFFIYLFINFNITFLLSEDANLVIEIDNPKFSEKGLDDKTYEIKAKKGLKSELQLELFIVEGKFKSGSDGRWIYLKADKGNYNQSSSFIELEKNIEIYTNDGEKLKSNFASFDMNNDIIKLRDNVTHSINQGLIVADKSVISKNFNSFNYEGNVNTTFRIGD